MGGEHGRPAGPAGGLSRFFWLGVLLWLVAPGRVWFFPVLCGQWGCAFCWVCGVGGVLVFELLDSPSVVGLVGDRWLGHSQGIPVPGGDASSVAGCSGVGIV